SCACAAIMANIASICWAAPWQRGGGCRKCPMSVCRAPRARARPGPICGIISSRGASMWRRFGGCAAVCVGRGKQDRKSVVEFRRVLFRAQLRLRGDYGEYCIDLLGRALATGRRVQEVPYVCVPRTQGESKTGANLWDYLVKGRKYVATIWRVRRRLRWAWEARSEERRGVQTCALPSSVAPARRLWRILHRSAGPRPGNGAAGAGSALCLCAAHPGREQDRGQFVGLSRQGAQVCGDDLAGAPPSALGVVSTALTCCDGRLWFGH